MRPFWGSMLTLGTKANLPLFVVAIYLNERYELVQDPCSPGAKGERPLRQRKQVQLNTGAAQAEANPLP